MLHKPDGHRFLIQLLEEQTEDEARDRVARIYGKPTAAACLFVKGTNQIRLGNGHGTYSWAESPKGFRAFLPPSFKGSVFTHERPASDGTSYQRQEGRKGSGTDRLHARNRGGTPCSQGS